MKAGTAEDDGTPDLVPGEASESMRQRTPARFLGRQPILDERRRLFGYELLFRAGEANAFSGDPEQATRDVIDQLLLLIPETEETLAFVNCTGQSLLEGTAALLPQANTVLEILETVDPLPKVLRACEALRASGYRFALDDFVPDPAYAPLVELAEFIKIDFRSTDRAARDRIYKMARGSRIRFLAEKIETGEEMRVARSEGCTLFQGYFFSRPVVVASKTVPQNQLVYLNLLAALSRVPAEVRELERLVNADTSLCYRVLRLANSALQGHPGTVSSVRGALIMIGDDAVRRLVGVALTGALAAHRSPALVSMALVRARFCELMAEPLSQPAQELYLLGLLSLLDVLLESPMRRVLATLPLPEEMKAALLGEGGPLAPALALVRSLETCEWEKCEALRQSLGIEESFVAGLYVESLRWASSMFPAKPGSGAAKARRSL